MTRITDAIATMPLRLEEGWSQVQINLADYTRCALWSSLWSDDIVSSSKAYGTTYVETLSITINANCRLRRVYFTDHPKSEDELPLEFKLYLPVNRGAA